MVRPGVEHVVHQNDVFALHGKRDFGGAHHRLDIHRGEIVAIEIDVENAHRNLAVFQAFDLLRQPLRQRNAAAANADERELIEVFGFFQNLVGQPDQRAVDFRSAHELGFFAGERHKAPKDRVAWSPFGGARFPYPALLSPIASPSATGSGMCSSSSLASVSRSRGT